MELVDLSETYNLSRAIDNHEGQQQIIEGVIFVALFAENHSKSDEVSLCVKKNCPSVTHLAKQLRYAERVLLKPCLPCA